MTERTINAERVEQLIDVFGSFDENVRKIEDAFGIKITNRNNELKVTGDEEAADKGCRAIEALLALSAKGEEIDEQKVRYLINLVNTGNEDQVSKMAKDVVCVTAKGRPVKAKTIGQQNYLKAIEKNTITIGVGPAGTGKTYLAVAEAVAAFRAKDGQPHYPDAPRRGGRRTAWLPAGRSAEQGRPLSAAALRRAVRYAGAGDVSESILSAEILRLRRWHICAGGRWTTALSFSTRRRTPRASR